MLRSLEAMELSDDARSSRSCRSCKPSKQAIDAISRLLGECSLTTSDVYTRLLPASLISAWHGEDPDEQADYSGKDTATLVQDAKVRIESRWSLLCLHSDAVWQRATQIWACSTPTCLQVAHFTGDHSALRRSCKVLCDRLLQNTHGTCQASVQWPGASDQKRRRIIHPLHSQEPGDKNLRTTVQVESTVATLVWIHVLAHAHALIGTLFCADSG